MNPRWPIALLWLCILAWVLFGGAWLIALAAQWIGTIGMAVFGS